METIMPTQGKAAKSTQKIRELIKTEELITLVQKNVLSPRAKPINQTKLHAIKMLLSKTLPDLKALEQTTTIEGEIDLNVEVTFLD